MEDIVLVVEDEEDLRSSLALLLEAEGYNVVTAANGREALDRLSEGTRPCIIILDLMMPVMNGWVFRAELLKDPDLAELPVVLFSGVSDIQQEAQSLKAVDYLTKPIDLDRLCDVVADHC